MAEELGTVGVEIEGDWGEFRRQAKSAVKDVGGGIRRGIGGSLKGVAGGIGRTTAVIAKGVGTAAIGLGAIGTAAAGVGIKAAADLETLNVALVQLTGSEEAARVQMKALTDFASTTPFEIAGLGKAQNALLATGKIAQEDVIPTMRGVGDSVAALGGSTEDVVGVSLALQKSFAKGKVDLESLNVISERGIPIMGELAAQMGVSEEELSKMISAGEVAPEVLAKAFQEPQGPLADFTGSTEKLSQTFSGVLSTLKDTVTLGLGQALTPALQKLTPIIQDLIPVVADLITNLGPVLGEVVIGLSGILTSILPLFSSLAEMLGPFLSEALAILVPALDKLVEPLSELLDAVLPPLLDVFLLLLESGLMVIIPVVAALAEVLGKLIPPVLEVVKKVASRLLPILTDTVGKILDALMPAFEVLIDLIGGPVGDILMLLFSLLEPFIPLLGIFAEIVSAVLTPVLEALGSVLGVVATFIGENLTPIVADLARFLEEGLASVLEAVQEWFSGFPEKVKGWMESAGDWLKGAGGDLIRGLWEGIKDMIGWLRDKVLGFASGIVDTVKGALGIGSPSKVMAEQGKWLGIGLAEGILGTQDEVAKAAEGLASAATVTTSSEFRSGTGRAGTARMAPVTNIFNAPVGGSMSEFAHEIERQRALEARFA